LFLISFCFRAGCGKEMICIARKGRTYLRA
jgi:hypothetical protein